jgi:uncharacterized membrane protein
MKRLTRTGIAATALLAFVALPVQTIAQEQSTTPERNNPRRYAVIDLGAVGNAPGQPYGITNDGLIVGAAAASDGAMHAVLWLKSAKNRHWQPGTRRTQQCRVRRQRNGCGRCSPEFEAER